LYAKGANLIPFHVLSTAVTERGVRDLLQSAVDANMNMIRIWGGGLYQVSMNLGGRVSIRKHSIAAHLLGNIRRKMPDAWCTAVVKSPAWQLATADKHLIGPPALLPLQISYSCVSLHILIQRHFFCWLLLLHRLTSCTRLQMNWACWCGRRLCLHAHHTPGRRQQHVGGSIGLYACRRRRHGIITAGTTCCIQISFCVQCQSKCQALPWYDMTPCQ
jgi:hypothetical protein